MITKEKFTNDIYELNQLRGKESVLLFAIFEEQLIESFNEYYNDDDDDDDDDETIAPMRVLEEAYPNASSVICMSDEADFLESCLRHKNDWRYFDQYGFRDMLPSGTQDNVEYLERAGEDDEEFENSSSPAMILFGSSQDCAPDPECLESVVIYPSEVKMYLDMIKKVEEKYGKN